MESGIRQGCPLSGWLFALASRAAGRSCVRCAMDGYAAGTLAQHAELQLVAGGCLSSRCATPRGGRPWAVALRSQRHATSLTTRCSARTLRLRSNRTACPWHTHSSIAVQMRGEVRVRRSMAGAAGLPERQSLRALRREPGARRAELERKLRRGCERVGIRIAPRNEWPPCLPSSTNSPPLN